jgi:hypothetical protein
MIMMEQSGYQEKVKHKTTSYMGPTTVCPVFFLLLFVVATSVVLIAVPGFFSHDELEILDSLSRSESQAVHWSWGSVRNAGFYRPLGYTILRSLLDTGGLAYPIVPHAALVLLHALVSVGVFFLVRELNSKDERLALVTSVLFAISPLAAFAVGWVAGIYDVLVTGFMVLAMLAFARLAKDTHWRWWAVLVLATIGAAGSKETWVVLPLYLALLFFAGCVWEATHRAIAALVCVCVLVALYLAVRYPGLSRVAQGGEGGYGVTVGENIFKNLFAYAAYPFTVQAGEITGIADHGLTAGAGFSMLLLGAVLVAAWQAFGQAWKPVALCAAFWLAYLLPVLPIGKYETQYLYGAGIALAYLLATVICSKKLWARVVGAIAVVLLLMHTAIIHASMYETGRCQTRLLTSLDTLIAARANRESGTTVRQAIAADEHAWWWVAARALHNSDDASDSRRFFRFSQSMDDAQLLFTTSCIVMPITEREASVQH